MTNWDERANQIFLDALDHDLVDERRAFVIKTCGKDHALRQFVEELLQAHASARTFLDQPIAQLPEAIVEAAPERELTQVGSYRILERLGEGGMGIVYHALREGPIPQHFALKIIKPGMDSRQVISRFEAERQALSRMDHPHIARVFDAGMTERSRPFFVMELVRGAAITQFCQRERLPLRQRLELFIEVCLAVQHAHQKGILHRDLKPTNVLVKLDEKPCIKVIDFGIAKAIGEPFFVTSLMTKQGQFVGTPAYMSPEQLGFGGLDVDTRSDVYSLGVMLYEMLTGVLPFDTKSPSSLERDEYGRPLRDLDAPSMMTRVKNLDEESTREHSTSFGLSPQDWLRTLRGELDWIVLKTLERDRERRYQSASHLAADLERYLRDDPVQASPPSVWYQSRKWIRRHRTAFLAGMSIVFALCVGLGLASWQAWEATKARRIANGHLADSQTATSRLTIALQQAENERHRAETQSEETRRLLYAGDMRLATYAWQQNDVRRMRELLGRHLPAPGQTDQRGFEWHFLWQHSEVPSRVVFKSDRPLHVIRLSPRQDRFAIGGADGQIGLFSATTFEKLAEIDSDQIEVNGLDFSPDSTQLASAGDDGTIALWDLQTKQCVRRISAHPSAVFQVVYLPGGRQLASAGRDSQIRIWNLSDGTPGPVLNHHLKSVESMIVSPRGELLTGSADNHVGAWDIQTQQLRWKRQHYGISKANAVAFVPATDLVAVGFNNGSAAVLTTETGGTVAVQTFPDAIHSLAVASNTSQRNPTWMAVGDRGGSIHLLPLDRAATQSGLVASNRLQQRTREWQAHTGRVYSMAFLSGASRLLSAGEDGRLLLWDLQDEDFVRREPDVVVNFAIGQREFILAKPTELVRMSFDRTNELTSTNATRPVVKDIQIAVASGRIFFLDQQRLWEWHRPENLELFQAPDGEELLFVACSRFGDELVVINGDNKNSRYELRWLGSSKGLSVSSSSVVHHVEFTSDGRYLIYDEVKDLLIRDGHTGDLVRKLSGHQSTIWSFAVSPDDRYVASGAKDRSVRVWDIESGKELWSEIAHQIETDAVVFSPDGETLATAGGDGILRLWRWKLGTLVLEYPLIDWPVFKLQFSPDGRQLFVHTPDQLMVYQAGAK